MKLVIPDIKSENLMTNVENSENSSATRSSYGINRSQTVVSEHNKFIYHWLMFTFYLVVVKQDNASIHNHNNERMNYI